MRVVGAREGRALNRRYRDRDYATNVLSFPVDLPRGVESPLLGDIVMCAPVIAREAAEQHKLARDHYAHMTVHGVLHLLGFDHLNRHDADAHGSPGNPHPGVHWASPTPTPHDPADVDGTAPMRSACRGRYPLE